MKLNKILILVLVLGLSLSSITYAEVDYYDLKIDLSENNTTLDLLNLNVLNMTLDVYRADLQSKSMNSQLNYFSDLGFPVSGTALSGMMYVRDVVPKQVRYGQSVLSSNVELTEKSLQVATRQMSMGIISSLDAYELSEEKYNFYKKEYDSALLKYDLGQLSKTGLLQAEVKYLETEVAFKKSERALEDSYLNLNKFLGYDFEKRYDLKRETKFDVTLKEPSYYLAFALENRFEIIDLKKQIDLQVEIADFYDYGNFLAYFSNHKARESALIEKEKLELDLELKKLEIAEEIYSAVSDIQIFSEQIDQLENTLKMQENNYANLLAQVKQGYMTESAIKELEFAITSIKHNLDVMIYSYNTKHYELSNATFFGPAYGGGM